MAHKKATGTSKNIGGSQPKYLGVKLYEGERARPGSILVRQRGTKILPGKNVRLGKDHTLFAVKEGLVQFSEKRKISFHGTSKKMKVVNVVSS